MGSTRFWTGTGPASELGRVTLSGEVVQDEPHVAGPVRRMDSWVLSYVSAGRGRYRDAQGRTHPISRGCVTVISPQTAHWYGTAPGEVWSELFAVFDGPIFDLLATTGVLVDRLPRRAVAPPSASVLRAVVATGTTDRAAADRRVLALAGWLTDLHATDVPGDAIAQAALELANDLTGEVDLPALAARLGLSYDTFRHRFTAAHGLAPGAYRTAARMAAAVKLVTLTDLGFRDIAHRLGYGDEFHFSKRFRSHHGAPPSSYRRHAIGPR